MPRKKDRKIPATNEITTYLHCSKCLKEMPPDYSPKLWQRIQVGFTELGIQVWCTRHDCNIMHMDFEGLKFPANTRSINSEEN